MINIELHIGETMSLKKLVIGLTEKFEKPNIWLSKNLNIKLKISVLLYIRETTNLLEVGFYLK